MSAGTIGAEARAPTTDAGVNPWLVAFASFMQNLDSTIANVVLPYIAGGLGVSVDESKRPVMAFWSNLPVSS
jgi:MFS transporter, DHA2 family, multidrug resistance protein